MEIFKELNTFLIIIFINNGCIYNFKKNFLSFSVKITNFILLLILIINFNLNKIINNLKIKRKKWKK